MPSEPYLIDASQFHRQLRLHVGQVDDPQLHASLLSLNCQHSEGTRPAARLAFASPAAEPQGGDLTHALRTIPIGTDLDIVQMGGDGLSLPVFSGTVSGRGLQAGDAGPPQVWIACEGMDCGTAEEETAMPKLTYGNEVTALVLGEYLDVTDVGAPPTSRVQPIVRGQVEVTGWLRAVPGDVIELHRAGSMFDGPLRVLAIAQCCDSQGTSSTLTVQGVLAPT